MRKKLKIGVPVTTMANMLLKNVSRADFLDRMNAFEAIKMTESTYPNSQVMDSIHNSARVAICEIVKEGLLPLYPYNLDGNVFIKCEWIDWVFHATAIKIVIGYEWVVIGRKVIFYSPGFCELTGFKFRTPRYCNCVEEAPTGSKIGYVYTAAQSKQYGWTGLNVKLG